MKVFLANPRGFCAGVERAIEIVERAINKHGAPIYVRHEVVHNQFVVNNLKEKVQYLLTKLIKCPKVVLWFLVLMVSLKESEKKQTQLHLLFMMQHVL